MAVLAVKLCKEKYHVSVVNPYFRLKSLLKFIQHFRRVHEVCFLQIPIYQTPKGQRLGRNFVGNAGLTIVNQGYVVASEL